MEHGDPGMLIIVEIDVLSVEVKQFQFDVKEVVASFSLVNHCDN